MIGMEYTIGQLSLDSKRVEIPKAVILNKKERKVMVQNEPRTIYDVELADDSGSISMTIWDEATAKKLKIGTRIAIKNAYVKVFRGKKELSLGKYGVLTILD